MEFAFINSINKGGGGGNKAQWYGIALKTYVRIMDNDEERSYFFGCKFQMNVFVKIVEIVKIVEGFSV